MTLLALLEPGDRTAWSPFLGARPVAELRAGIWTIRERWEAVLGLETAVLVGPVPGFTESGEPRTVPAAEPGRFVLARSDFVPAARWTAGFEHAAYLVNGGVPVGSIVTHPSQAAGTDPRVPTVEVEGMWLRGAFDLVTALDRFAGADCEAFLEQPSDPLPPHSIVLGDPSRVRILGADVEPGAVFDVRHGVVVIEQGAEVRNGTRLEGPCYVGPGCRVLGGFIRASVLGPWCVVRGEVSNTVFNGYANKAHDGFVGHSVLGHWVNLGAGTTTSNLKNTYGQVRLSVDGTPVETGRQFLGTLFGDHAKTAIGTMMPTGSIVGTGASVFGPGGGKYVPPFAWGAAGTERVTEEGFLQVASRVLPRRAVEFTDQRRDGLRAVYRRLTGTSS